MTQEYQQHYIISEALASETQLIPSPERTFDRMLMYASVMDRLAQPLPSGQPSPFTSQDPSSGHGHLVGAFLYLLELLVHMQNLVADATWVNVFRMLGAEVGLSEYPILRQVFRRDRQVAQAGLLTEVPFPTVVRSDKDPDLYVITTEPATFDSTAETVMVPARLSIPGLVPDLLPGEFSILPRNITHITSTYNDGVIFAGREPESFADAMLRVRDGIRTGSLGRISEGGQFVPASATFYGRAVNAPDFEYYVLNLGATKVLVLPPGEYSQALTIAVYPPEAATALRGPISEISMVSEQLIIRPAEIVPVSGTITIRVNTYLSDAQAREIAAQAIYPRYDRARSTWGQNEPVGVNPPAGIWGDPNFAGTLATALEDADGIIAVPEMALINETTGESLDDLEVKPWHLFEVQASIVFNVRR